MLDETEFIVDKKLSRKNGKNNSYNQQKDFFMETKSKVRPRNALSNAIPSSSESFKLEPNFLKVCNDIWWLISQYIPPEEIQKFALICPETAELVKSKRFWCCLYKRYCKRWEFSGSNIKLPLNLQIENVKRCDANFIRCCVIESLYICYEPFTKRLKEGYTLDFLTDRYYLSSWYMENHCLWMICYKFSNLQLNVIKEPSDDVKESWENLDNEYFNSKRYVHPHEGVSLLVIFCNHFTPFPTQLLYSGTHNQISLTGTRQMLTNDMRCCNLELDFRDGISKNNITVVYLKILKYKILPWWHPEFKTFNK